MTKSELIEAIASQVGMTKTAVSKVIASLAEVVTTELTKGGQIILPGFITMKTANRPGRVGRNPQTGMEIKIAPRRVAVLKAGKQLKEAIQE